jgi:riboflavin biosynthesis pyrimidine reductase
VDEVCIFLGNKILGGPLLMYKGKGFKLEESPFLENMEVVEFEDCLLLRGRLRYV